MGPTLAPTRTTEPQPWGLRIGIALLLVLAVVVIVVPFIWSVDPTFESIEGLSELGEPLDFGAVDHPLGTDPRAATSWHGYSRPGS